MVAFFYLTGFLVYLLFAVLFTFFYYKGRAGKKKIRALVFFALLLVVPFSDLVLQFFFIQVRTLFSPPLQQVSQRVEYPGSVYWEDKVWPGFDEFGRNWMVQNYLDGKHLQLLAMNGDDGMIYLYKYKQEGFERYKSRDSLPPLDYYVVLEKTPLLFFERPLLWADKVTILSNKEQKTIAYSNRYCGYGWWLGYHPVGDFARGYSKGDIKPFEFSHEILFRKLRIVGVNVSRSRDLLDRTHYKLIQ
jgi:hypothetical protein